VVLEPVGLVQVAAAAAVVLVAAAAVVPASAHRLVALPLAVASVVARKQADSE
jgi:hypothetical protein